MAVAKPGATPVFPSVFEALEPDVAIVADERFGDGVFAAEHLPVVGHPFFGLYQVH